MGSDDPATKAIEKAYKLAAAAQEPRIAARIQLRQQTMQALRIKSRLDCALANTLMMDEETRQLYEHRDQFEATVQQCNFEHAATTMKIDLLIKVMEGTAPQNVSGAEAVVDVKEQTTVDVGQDTSPVLGVQGKGFSSSSKDRVCAAHGAGDASQLISFLSGF